MALNRNLYPTSGTNIVKHGQMLQRWLVNTAGTDVNVTTDEYGLANNATAGRGLNVSAFTTGRFTVSLDAGNSVADILKADASITSYIATPVDNYFVMPEVITSSSVTFQVWKTVAAGPVVSRSNPPVSVTGSVSTPFSLGTSPFVALSTGLATTFTRVPVTVVATGGVPIAGLTMTLTTAAATPTTTGSFTIGKSFTITNVGDTDFTLIGASSNAIGVQFTSTGLGGGTTGTANTATVATAAFDQSGPTIAALLATGVPATATTYTVTLPANLGSTTATCNAATAFGTVIVTQASPVYLSVNIQFTQSAVPA